jgi:hypothetical protein
VYWTETCVLCVFSESAAVPCLLEAVIIGRITVDYFKGHFTPGVPSRGGPIIPSRPHAI